MTESPFPIQIEESIILAAIGTIMLFVILGIMFIFLPATAIVLFTGKSYWTVIGQTPFLMKGIIYGTIAMFIFLIFGTLYQYLYTKSISYSLDKENFVFREGIIARSEKTLPYSRIQHIIIYEGWLPRQFGVVMFSIETAREINFNQNASPSNIAAAMGPMIPNLRKEDAQKLRSYILAYAIKAKPIAGI